MNDARRPGFCPRFLLTDEAALGGEVALDSDDSRHALKVLRLRAGDCCEVVTPSGTVHSASVTSVGNRVRVLLAHEVGEKRSAGLYAVSVGIVQALARPSAVDLVIEKGTEVGASFFMLVRSAGSPGSYESRLEDRVARWRKIAREATKQSKQTLVPDIAVARSVTDGLADLAAGGVESLVLDPAAATGLPEALAGCSRRKLALWIGPEGGWAPDEIEAFRKAGVPEARLGRSVLRTETAGPVAVALARVALGDW
jgi:16S rRNA (uracil1498-N3)-methyltransferase